MGKMTGMNVSHPDRISAAGPTDGASSLGTEPSGSRADKGAASLGERSTSGASSSGTVLIVDDEVALARYLARLLNKRGYFAECAFTASSARSQMKRHFPDVVLMDLRLPDGDGAELMQELKQEYPESQFIIITAHGSIRSAVASTKQGAVDYLTKPFEPEEMELAVKNALRGTVLSDEVQRLRSSRSVTGIVRAMKSAGGGGDPAFSSPATRRMFLLAQRAAESEGIVLLLGESGTGKDYLSRWIHRRSARNKGPFFDVNCAALSRELAESELFGHEPGAFTGTRGRKRGLLELAENGTLLLNEIGDLDLSLQSKLLTFLDSRSFVRVGGERSISVNARIFAATNRDLEKAVSESRFRSDLYYRINVFPIEMPALRDRREDIPAIAEELLVRLKVDLGLSEIPRLDESGTAALMEYDWPGNIREMRNVLERSIMLTRAPVLTREHLNIDGRGGEWELRLQFDPGRNLHDVTREVARRLVTEALHRGRTKQEAARLLGISRHALAHQIKVLDIEE
jgi:two-component system response regulator AtoC